MQHKNEKLLIDITEDGISNCLRDLHPEKANSPISSISKWTREMHSAKSFAFDEGIVTFSKEE